MKNWVWLVIGFWLNTTVFAQSFNNQWIDYNNQYLYFKIVDKGVYRINYSTLNSALNSIGSSLSNPNFNPNQLKLEKFGKQVPIYVADGGDGTIGPGDFIEFFAEGNTGWLDSALYDAPENQNNKNFSLFSDTAYYYLSLNTNLPNQRVSVYNNTNYNAYTPANFVLNKSYQQYTTSYQAGATDFSGKTESEYTEGEGWFDAVFTYLGSRTKNIATPNPYIGAGAPQVQFSTVVTGASNATNISGNDHRLGISINNNLVYDFSFEGYKLIKFNQNFPASVITGSSTSVKYESLPLPSPPASDRMAVAWVEIEYPQLPNFNNQSSDEFYTSPNAAPTRIDGNNFSPNSPAILYDLASNSRCIVSQTGSSFQVLVPPGAKKRCYLTTEANIKNVTNISPINGNGNFINYSSIAPDSAYVIITHNSLIQGANQFALRKQQSGFNTMVINVNELYHQFAFGIRKHPLSIRGFADFALQNFNSPPQYLFLIGKSVSDYLCRNNATNYASNLVPSYGFPTTDVLLTAGLGNTKYEMAIATGRLVAINNNQIIGYADKVTQFEQASNNPYNFQNKEWMKNILHFGGGANASEQRVLRNYLINYEDMLTDTFYGGEVTSFFKNTTSIIQSTVSDSVKNLINNGISMLNFFGHAAGTALDISIEDVNAYNNFGKYFLFIANSCNVGDLHTPPQSIQGVNESFVLTPGKGAIGFLASVTLGYPSRLNLYTDAFLKNLSQDNYGQPIGKLMQKAVIDVQSNNIMKSTCYEMTLHGDPSLSLYPHAKPDYVLSNSRYSVNPQNVSAEMQTFDVNLLITNLGKAVNRRLNLEVKRQYPNGTDTVFNVDFDAPLFKDTLTISFPVQPEKSIGQNQISFSLDYPLVKVDEIENVNNNLLNIDVWITSDELIPVYPSDLAIVPQVSDGFYTIAASPNPQTTTYIFQIDTNDQFNSPAFQEISQTTSNSIIHWQPNLTNLSDSAVYFWRVSPQANPNFKWREASFTYISGKRGWGQTSFHQLKNNQFNFINYQKSLRKNTFLPNQKQLEVQNIGHPNTQSEFNFIEYRLNGELKEYGVCPPASPSMYIAVIDSVTLEPWGTHFIENTLFGQVVHNPNNSFGNNNDLGGCRKRVEYFFTYVLSNPTQFNAMLNLLQNEVPTGNYILAYTVIRGNFSDSLLWTPQAKQVFEDLGATQISTLTDSVPYIFFTQKGRKSKTKEVSGNQFRDVISLSATISNNLPSGSYLTPKIGPSKKWSQLNWKFTQTLNNKNDSVTIDLLGITPNNQTQNIISFKGISGSESALQNIIDANNFPFIMLRANFTDDSLFTPAQPDYLHVVFDEYSEYAVNTSKNYAFYNDTLQQGEEIQLNIIYNNLGLSTDDSVKIQYQISNNQPLDVIEINKKIKFNQAFQTISDTLKYSTINLNGPYTLTGWINPQINDSAWIPERFMFNNRYSKLFFVQQDKTNPLLDVTFDGIHILDGDIVSPTPLITISLNDENQYLALNDTQYFSMYIIDPSNTSKRIPFFLNGKENISFKPGTLPENKAELQHKAQFNQDGIYKLSVRATDASGNRSGSNDFNISFEVVQKSTLTEVMNYPNPFSTATRFVFTLTGNEIPEVFTIQILTVTGKVVREITKTELGNIHIGRNITDYAWDGRDEFGDPMGNGVYLYRVITKINGSEIEKRVSGADNFFHKGFGKMYLMR